MSTAPTPAAGEKPEPDRHGRADAPDSAVNRWVNRIYLTSALGLATTTAVKFGCAVYEVGELVGLW